MDINIAVTDANNITLEVTPTPTQTITIDRGIAGPQGPMGDGDVTGPASATDKAIVTFDGTTGKLIQNNSGNTIGTTGNTIISVTDNVNAALRVTQLSTATNAIALLVEDSANPDPTPFVIDATGRVVAGYTSVDSSWYTTGNTPTVWQVANSSNRNGFGSINYSGPGGLSLFRAGGGVIGTEGAVSSGDALGIIAFAGYDGINANAFPAAAITALVDLDPGNSSMPGRLVFSTTANGASAPTERMRIDSSGGISIGTGASALGSIVNATKNITGSVTSYGVLVNSTVQSDVTTTANAYFSRIGTQAAAFTLPNLAHYNATQGTIGAGNIVTTHYGFNAQSSLTGGTNNYGFYGNIAAPTTGITTTGTISTISSSGTTVTVNHSAGTYTNGQTVTITATAVITNLVIGVPVTILTLGSTTTQANWNTLAGTIGVTYVVGSTFTTAAAGTGLGDGTVILNVQGSGKTVASTASNTFNYATTTSQTFAAVTVLTGTITVSTRFNLYMNGTANNYMAGNVLIGSSTSVSIASGEGRLQVIGTTNATAQAAIGRFSNDVDRPRLSLYKSRSGTIGTNAIVQNNDAVGDVVFQGADNTNYVVAARISTEIDGNTGTNNMPGRLLFSTTAIGASSPTERMRIDSAGQVGIGTTTLTGYNLRLGKSLTGAATSVGFDITSTIQSDVTTNGSGFRTQLSTQAASFTLGTIAHYQANQITIGATSLVTNQYAFLGQGTLTGATNNYGFYGNIAAPTSGITTTGTISTISSSGTTVTVNHSAGTYTNGQTITIAATANATSLVLGATATILTLGTTDYAAIGAATSSVTFTNSDDLVTYTAHGLSEGQPVYFSVITTTTGILINTLYYAKNITTNTFQLAASPGGSVIGLTNDGTGTAVKGVFTATGVGTGTGTVTLNVQGSGKTVAGAASNSFTFTTTTSQTFTAISVLAGTVTVSTRYNLYMSGTAANYFAGDLTVYGGTAIPAGGTTGSGYKLSSTTNFGVFFGSGAPTLSAAKGSLYLRSDGTTTNNRMYVNTDGATIWTAVTTAA